MRRAVFLTVEAGIAILVVACGGGGPTLGPGTTTAPATPGPTATTAAAPTVAPPTQSGGSPPAGGCTGGATFDPSDPDQWPSFAPDSDLAARFPQQIDGQPVAGLKTFTWTEFICAYAGQQAIDAWKEEIPERFHAIVDGLSYGSAEATVDGESVEIGAFRAVGHDGTFLSVLYAELSQMVRGELPEGYQGSTSYLDFDGRRVTVWTDEGGSAAYLYLSTDTLFRVSDVTESQARKVVAALP